VFDATQQRTATGRQRSAGNGMPVPSGDGGNYALVGRRVAAGTE